MVLPFEAISTECPDELHREPYRVNNFYLSYHRYEWAHTYKQDFLEGYIGCTISLHETGVLPSTCPDPLPRCADPPRGRLDWQSNHHSAHVIVNSPVTLRVGDTLSQTRTVYWVGNSRRANRALYTDSGLRYEYPGGSPGDPIIRTWHQADTSATYGSVSDLARGGDCFVRDLPQFRILVEELWPDNDATAIEDLFGTGTLNWWMALTQEEQRRHTETRGLVFTVGMTPAQLDDELDRRARILNDEISCNHGRDVWCRWTPTRSGYYRLTAAGGWTLRSFLGLKTWVQAHHIRSFDDFLRNHFNAGDGDCLQTDDFARGRDYDCIMEHLGLMGMTPAQIGLVHDPILRTFTGLLPRGPHQDNEWLYSAAAGENYRCPPLDVRVACGSSGGAVNYTETEPIGIQVHEVRVSTVMPTN